MRLFIANKNYSSWSMRPWVLLRHFEIGFDEVQLQIDSFATDSAFKRAILAVNPTGKVPALQDGDLLVWDSLAIAEYLAEKFPQHHLWPIDRAARARARSVCAEMHSGFSALRSHCSMNIEADLRHIGAILLRDQAALGVDLARISAIWGELLAQSGGPYLFGDFCIADAYFAPVIMRCATYGLPLDAALTPYIQHMQMHPAVQAWVAAACAEASFTPFAEPYRASR